MPGRDTDAAKPLERNWTRRPGKESWLSESLVGSREMLEAASLDLDSVTRTESWGNLECQ